MVLGYEGGDIGMWEEGGLPFPADCGVLEGAGSGGVSAGGTLGDPGFDVGHDAFLELVDDVEGVIGVTGAVRCCCCVSRYTA